MIKFELIVIVDVRVIELVKLGKHFSYLFRCGDYSVIISKRGGEAFTAIFDLGVGQCPNLN